jgi:DNA-binding protein Fis
MKENNSKQLKHNENVRTGKLNRNQPEKQSLAERLKNPGRSLKSIITNIAGWSSKGSKTEYRIPQITYETLDKNLGGFTYINDKKTLIINEQNNPHQTETSQNQTAETPISNQVNEDVLAYLRTNPGQPDSNMPFGNIALNELTIDLKEFILNYATTIYPSRLRRETKLQSDIEFITREITKKLVKNGFTAFTLPEFLVNGISKQIRITSRDQLLSPVEKQVKISKILAEMCHEIVDDIDSIYYPVEKSKPIKEDLVMNGPVIKTTPSRTNPAVLDNNIQVGDAIVPDEIVSPKQPEVSMVPLSDGLTFAAKRLDSPISVSSIEIGQAQPIQSEILKTKLTEIARQLYNDFKLGKLNGNNYAHYTNLYFDSLVSGLHDLHIKIPSGLKSEVEDLILAISQQRVTRRAQEEKNKIVQTYLNEFNAKLWSSIGLTEAVGTQPTQPAVVEETANSTPLDTTGTTITHIKELKPTISQYFVQELHRIAAIMVRDVTEDPDSNVKWADRDRKKYIDLFADVLLTYNYSTADEYLTSINELFDFILSVSNYVQLSDFQKKESIKDAFGTFNFSMKRRLLGESPLPFLYPTLRSIKQGYSQTSYLAENRTK